MLLTVRATLDFVSSYNAMLDFVSYCESNVTLSLTVKRKTLCLSAKTKLRLSLTVRAQLGFISYCESTVSVRKSEVKESFAKRILGAR